MEKIIEISFKGPTVPSQRRLGGGGGLTVRVVCRIQCLDRSPQYRQRSNHTVQVEVAVSLVSVSSLSLARMEVSLELHLTQTWADPRCRFRSLAGWEDTVTLQGAGLQHRCPHCSITAVYDGVPVSRLEHLWLPDTVITPAVEVTARPQQTTAPGCTTPAPSATAPGSASWPPAP